MTALGLNFKGMTLKENLNAIRNMEANPTLT
jgi:hypothetical protein